MKILIVDDEEISLSSVKRILKWKGFKHVDTCDNGKEAIARIKQSDYDIVLLDLLMPEVDGLQVLESTKPFKPATEFIILTAVYDIPTTVKAVRLGAYDYLVKPIDNELLFLSIERAYERISLLAGLSASAHHRESEIPPAFSQLISRSASMKALISYAQVMARSGNPVLITGESGTGKELMALGIHKARGHADGPFIAVNVSAIPSTMFESHIFGHVKGAFTGAEHNHTGYLEQANGGSLFFDEIGELPMELQAKLLRVLEEKSFTPLGGTRPVHADVCFISASNRDLNKACREGKFRLDLLYRIKAAHIHLPPLRERREDIPLLASHFLEEANHRHNARIKSISPQAMDILIQGEYPGNVRELAQIVENAALLCDTESILPVHLNADGLQASSLFTRTLSSLKENHESHIAYVLTQTAGDRKQAARVLGITVRQLQRNIAEMRKSPVWRDVLGDL